MSDWKAKHVLAASLALSVGLLIAPTASQAIGGSLATIVDQATSSTAKVTSDGALRVVAEPGLDPARAINSAMDLKNKAATTRVPSPTFVAAPRLLAITGMTVANGGTGTVTVSLNVYRRTSGTAGCSALSTSLVGFSSPYVVRSVIVPANTTVNVELGTMPAYAPAPASGQISCVVWGVGSASDYYLHTAFTGFRY